MGCARSDGRGDPPRAAAERAARARSAQLPSSPTRVLRRLHAPHDLHRPVLVRLPGGIPVHRRARRGALPPADDEVAIVVRARAGAALPAVAVSAAGRPDARRRSSRMIDTLDIPPATDKAPL